ncbi:hypothetical protein [Pseudomonas phage vB_PaeM_PAO1_Ab17]|uniref:Uncharacterized protein n=1 Tax=Pseudomonas phage vB_PaeM_PAO1_Ab17 TaxID=1548904 RepID=A0A0A1IUK7_9CAUD|nr:hypothetical protein [Pseudomonas phage vB_PaeM_PAO1_Ab17]
MNIAQKTILAFALVTPLAVATGAMIGKAVALPPALEAQAMSLKAEHAKDMADNYVPKMNIIHTATGAIELGQVFGDRLAGKVEMIVKGKVLASTHINGRSVQQALEEAAGGTIEDRVLNKDVTFRITMDRLYQSENFPQFTVVMLNSYVDGKDGDSMTALAARLEKQRLATVKMFEETRILK